MVAGLCFKMIQGKKGWRGREMKQLWQSIEAC